MKINRACTYLFLLAFSVVFLTPILMTVSNSFMSAFEIGVRYSSTVTAENFTPGAGNTHFAELSLIPNFVSLRQYADLLFDTPLYLGLFWNSVKLAVPIVFLQMLISFPAAYAFEFSKWRLKEAVFFIYIVVMLMPLQVSLVPHFLMAEFFHLDGWLAIVLPAAANPFGVFLIRQSLKGLPYEYVEAAKIDGASNGHILILVILPMLKSIAAALMILTFVENWNIVEQAVVFIKEMNAEPLSSYMMRLSAENSPIIFAASCFYMLPMLLIFLYGQENMVEGVYVQ
jgi:multiple sugar transport system permease protein